MDNIAEKELFIKQMLAVYDVSTSGKALFSQQGQGMDGYSELANYRSIIKNFIREKGRAEE